ncbi:TonB-dependent receptor [Bacteroidia bacterium]|nr:TonB-dependent receptor [Bacteroidia bacterium]
MRTLYFITLITINLAINAQIQIVNNNLEHISGVLLIQSSKIIGISDQYGKINIDTSSKELDNLFLSHKNYYQKELTPEILQSNTTIILTKKINTFDPIVVSGGRNIRYKNDIALLSQRIDKKKIELFLPQTSADLLNVDNNIYIQKSQQGGGSPIIRGFATNRILLVVDGVRMNTAIFRSGNVQNVISIDPYTVESTDLIFGPSSQFYGSDAIGGVLNFTTINPEFSEEGVTLKTKNNFRYSSANNENTYHTQFQLSGRKIASITSFTYSKFGDLRIGKKGNEVYGRPDYISTENQLDTIIPNSDESIQINSGYSQKNFLHKISFKPNSNLRINYNFHYSETSNIPRYDRLIERDESNKLYHAEWYYGPQTWMMNNLALKYTKKHVLFDRIKSTIAHQKFVESRNTRAIYSSNLKQREEQVNAWSLNTDFIKHINTKTQINYGLEYVTNLIQSSGNQININSNLLQPITSRYPDQSTWKTGGIYFNVIQRWNNHAITEGGLRYNIVGMNGQFDTSLTSYPISNYNIINQAITGSISQLIKRRFGSISFILSTAFRSPNIDDIGKTFDSNPGFVTIPNPNLKPEYAYHAEANLDYNIFKNVKVQNSIFYTYLDQSISLSNTTLNGQDSILYDNSFSQVQMLANEQFASVLGNQITLKYTPNEFISLKTTYTFLASESSSGNTIRHITPNFGGITLMLNYKKFDMSIYSIYNQRFNNSQFSNSEKNKTQFYLRDKFGLAYSPAWYTLNFKFGYYLTTKTKLNFGIENLTDKRYRPYSSRLTAPGRNIILAMQVKL